jgi:fructose-1-phosphate kinase PfkB-like protein
VLVVSGSLPEGADPSAVLSLLRLARERGVPAIADVPGALLTAAVEAGASHVKPNRAELAEATGIVDPLEAAQWLAARGATVLASLDAEGLMLVGEGIAVAAALDQPLEGNTTGAGDAAVAALAASLADGETDPAAIARRCALWSAAAVLHPLAGSIGAPDDPVLDALSQRIRTRQLEA